MNSSGSVATLTEPQFSYDVSGNVTTLLQCAPSICNGSAQCRRVFRLGYDLGGNLTASLDPAAGSISSEYAQFLQYSHTQQRWMSLEPLRWKLRSDEPTNFKLLCLFRQYSPFTYDPSERCDADPVDSDDGINVEEVVRSNIHETIDVTLGSSNNHPLRAVLYDQNGSQYTVNVDGFVTPVGSGMPNAVSSCDPFNTCNLVVPISQ